MGLEKGIVIAVIILLVAIAVAYAYINSTKANAHTTTTIPTIGNTTTVGINPTTTASTIGSTTSVTTSVVTQPAGANGTNVSTLQDFIAVDPVNLSQISQISKFRSCSGHDYSGYDVQGYLETNRSMKHYFSPIQQLSGTTGKIQEYAPFNGTVERVVEEQTPVGKQVWVGYTSSGPQSGYPPVGIWHIVFFHMDPVPGITVGSHVTAGQLIGYANQTSPIQEFDMALTQYNGSNGIYNQVLDSIFNHMTPQVLAQFMAVGVNQNDIIISKAYRDANPCNFNVYVYNPNDSVVLT
ncbi:MAG TPA: hypothetical protein VND15_04375 [Candidatus Acidoferrales bacterium]|nr:hypothetical protein [Candidatus Acidoferrales bacterium]